MEEQEAPLEDVHEEIHHHAEHSRERWISGVALSTALLAALAAICSLFSGDHADESLLEQMRATDQWSYYQAKGIKANQLETKIELVEAGDKAASDKDRGKLRQYRQDQVRIRQEAEAFQHEAEEHHAKHGVLAKGVTMFQIAIAVSAISVLTRRQWFWFMGLCFGAVGLFFLIHGQWLKHAPAEHRENAQTSEA